MSRSSGCPGSLKARPGVVFHMISADFAKLFHAFVRPLFELRALTAAQRQLEFSFWAARCRRGRGLALATDFPRLWNDPATPDRERKRMARLLIEDVTMTKGEGIALGVRLRSGATEPLALPLEPRACDSYRTPAGVVAEIDALLEDYTDAAVARILNDRGRRPLKGGAFSAERVQRVRRTYGLKPRCERLRARGLLDLKEMAERLGVTTGTVKKWRD